MKKKILGGLLVVAIAAVAAFNVNMNTEKNELSLLALANVEALAQAEAGGESGGSGSGSCGVYAWTGHTWTVACNISKTEALEIYNWYNTSQKYWCCSSCSSTSYCGR